ncbi:PIN domain-containing protein [Pirellulimonas nuda]|uniref:PIN domain-containing protein n=1 Tax=Pirellulimonas nuda TaxID=2528009 RepID=UPI0011A882C0|nr:PIN domain-containing protein [Pirellulimonas nuda]
MNPFSWREQSVADRILDTSVLIQFWATKRPSPGYCPTQKEAAEWAADLIQTHGTRSLVTPVCIEMLAGCTNSDSLLATRAFLAAFEVVDDGSLSKETVVLATSIAERIPHGGRRQDVRKRDLGDCLIRALADRHSRDVLTLDRGMPRSRS